MQAEKLTQLINLERDLRTAGTHAAIRYIIVNKTRSLVGFEQSALLEKRYGEKYRVSVMGNVSVFEDSVPFSQWLANIVSDTVKKRKKSKDKSVLIPVSPADSNDEDWKDFSFPYGVLIFLSDPVTGEQGILWLSKSTPWQDAELKFFTFLSEIYGHALSSRRREFFSLDRTLDFIFSKKLIILAILAGVSFIPVNLTVMAPAEIVPDKPFLVTAPIDGVVSEIKVENNKTVKKGDLLVQLEETELKNQLNISVQALSVANAEFSKTQRAGFIDMSQNYRLAELQAQASLRRAEVAYNRDRMNKGGIKAERDGIAVVDEADKWKGRPVMTGERILTIADPQHIKLQIMVPVQDAIGIRKEADVKIYLYTNPFEPVTGKVEKSSFTPELTEANVLAYKVTAEMDANQQIPRIGLRGMAKIECGKVSLFYYLFRRPVTALRQKFGV